MPQALLCKRCKQPFVFTGAGIELLPGNRVGYRHSCGAVNELHLLHNDERGRALYRVVGLIGASKHNSASNEPDNEGINPPRPGSSAAPRRAS